MPLIVVPRFDYSWPLRLCRGTDQFEENETTRPTFRGQWDLEVWGERRKDNYTDDYRAHCTSAKRSSKCACAGILSAFKR